MPVKTRFLDDYFRKKIQNLGISATENEVTRFFNENGWRLYDMETMLDSFMKWRKGALRRG